MSFSNERSVLEKYFEDNWTLFTPIVPYRFDNIPFSQQTNTEWVSFSILRGETFPASVTVNKVRNIGIVSVQIFAPQHKGSDSALKLADNVKSIFNFKAIQMSGGYATFFTTRVDMIGVRDGWYQVNTLSEFKRDEESN